MGTARAASCVVRRMTRLLAVPLALLAAAPAAAQAPNSPEAARGTVQRYYAAIERGDYRAAYGLWSDAGRASGKNFGDFVRGFARTAHTKVYVGAPGRDEGAAGTTYITVPVEVRAILKNGGRQRFTGRYTLRRSNNVPGSTWAQRQWRIASATLRQR